MEGDYGTLVLTDASADVLRSSVSCAPLRGAAGTADLITTERHQPDAGRPGRMVRASSAMT